MSNIKLASLASNEDTAILDISGTSSNSTTADSLKVRPHVFLKRSGSIKRDRDEFELPILDQGVVTNIKSDDPRFDFDNELLQYLKEYKPDMGEINLDTFDELPIATKFEIISELRGRSRQTSDRRLKHMKENAPKAIDFSQLQIQNLMQRNQLTQKYLDVVGIGDERNLPNATTARVASLKNRSFSLVKNADSGGGWKLAQSTVASSLPSRQAGLVRRSSIPKHESKKIIVSPPEVVDIEWALEDSYSFENISGLSVESTSKVLASDNSNVLNSEDEFEEVGVSNDVNQDSDDDCFEEVKQEHADFEGWRKYLTDNVDPAVPESDVFYQMATCVWPYEVLLKKKEELASKQIDPEDPMFDQLVCYEEFLNTVMELRFPKGGDVFIEDNLKTSTSTRLKMESDSCFAEVESASRPIHTASFESSSILHTEYEPTVVHSNIPLKPETDSSDSCFAEVDSASGPILRTSFESSSSLHTEYEPIEVHNNIPLKVTTNPNMSSPKSSKSATTEIYANEYQEPKSPASLQIPTSLSPKVSQESILDPLSFDSLKAHIDNQPIELVEDIEATSIVPPIAEPEVREGLEKEIVELTRLQNAQKRIVMDPAASHYNDIKELLTLFGVPYMDAQSEAEAQCAELTRLGLADGIVTDDSDVFLFGGTPVFRNLFRQSKPVEGYCLKDIEQQLNLPREKLIQLAHLLGSDYTDGITGVGPVKALEILDAFPEGLVQFYNWYENDIKSAPLEESPAKKKLRKLVKRLHIPKGFPNSQVTDSYLKPNVNSEKRPFSWGSPNLPGLQLFLRRHLNWSEEKVNELVEPVIRHQNRLDKSIQTTISQFFTRSKPLPANSHSKRIDDALQNITATYDQVSFSNPEGSDDEFFVD
ncbi:DNA repair protein rad2 [Entomophthora muscae]|uniref:DNA repair protein rad2 n=1 Tax=Entomophthora muscae TaxID=34485 RepID=A0ACC2SV05_9FUNG|nr:DNA repair protein rad2 [Entomophthora muscae]